jgi:hypothetical protein
MPKRAWKPFNLLDGSSPNHKAKQKGNPNLQGTSKVLYQPQPV